jgi:anionic cell wall polymer biosynthesis LytR-Cps2A-Psr (LCP) family protein
MPPEDKSNYDDEDYSLRKRDDYSNEPGDDNEYEYKPKRGIPDESEQNGRGRNYDEQEHEKEYEDGRYEKEPGFRYKERLQEDKAGQSYEEDFFTDRDFEFQDSGDDEYFEPASRSSKVRSRRKRRKMIFSSVAVMAILAVIAIGIVFGYRFIKNKYFSQSADTSVSAEESIIIPGDIKLAEDISVVISCAGENLLEPQVNTVLFAKYTANKEELVSLCIPANTLFEIPGFGQNNASEAVVFGGMDLLKLAIKNNIGMDVENYILFDVANTVNKLESIKLELEDEITIADSDGSSIKLKEGENIINGETAYSFLNYFSGSQKDVPASDITMQKLLIDSIFKKIVGSKEGDLSKNLSSISDFIDTDLSLEELSEFISTVAYLESSSNKYYALEGRQESIDENTLVFVPNISGIAELFDQETAPEETSTSYETGPTVGAIVLNGVGTPGIAGKVSDLLKSLIYSDGTPRYNMTTPADADNYDYQETLIIIRTDDEQVMKAADYIAGAFLTGNIEISEDGSQQTDIVVIIGKDFDYDKAAANVEKILSDAGATGDKQDQQSEGTDKDENESETTASQEQADQSTGGQIYSVIILNGEGTQGIALTAKGILDENLNKSSEVLTFKEPRNADSFNYNVTKIITHTDKPGISKIAEDIRDALGIGAVSQSSDNPDNVDITIILGSDYTK